MENKPQKRLGRPIIYKPETICPKIEEYISQCGREQTSLPTIEGLAIHLGVNPDTIYEWRKIYPEFSEATKKILALQKKQLIDDGLYGGKEVNAAMAIFLLKANHGMKEDSPIQINQQFNTSEMKVNFISYEPEHQTQS